MLDEARSFFKLLWPDTSLVDHLRLSLWRLPGKDCQHVPPSHAEAALEDFSDVLVATGAYDGPPALEGAQVPLGPAQTHALYFGVGLRRTGLGRFERGEDADTMAWPGVWVDLDYGTVGHAGKNYPPSDTAALEIADKFPVHPTLTVQSGHGFHLYWLFDKPFFAHTEAERKHFASVLVGLQKKFRDLAEPYKVDKTDDVGRVLGVPGLWNCKKLVPPVRVAILLDDGPRYKLTDLEAFRGRSGRPPKSPPPAATGQVVGGTPPSDDKVKAGGGAGPLPAPEPAQAKKRGRPADVDKWPAWVLGVRRRVKNTTDAEKKRKAELLLDGEPFAESGERNNTCNSMVGLLTNYVFKEKPDTTPDEIYDTFFAASIIAMALADDNPENPALHKDEVLGQISRMWELVLEEHEREQEQARRFADALRRGAVRKKGGGGNGSNGHGGANGHGQGNGVTALAVIDKDSVEVEPALGEYDTPDGLPPVPPPQSHDAAGDDPLRLLIIQYKDAFFIWRDDKYQPHVSRDELETKARDDFEDAPGVTWYYENDKGVEKRKTLQMFKNDYCTVARHLVFDLTNPNTEYDPESETLFVAAAPLRDLEPAFNEQIHEWLMLFGGKEADRLIDWLATLTDLNYQTCALYASGHPSTGKSLLASGLAKLWSEAGAPTTLKNIMGNFNADLMRCPLIYADEALPFGCHTTDLRELVGSSSRAVTQKFIPNADLRGAIRLLLTSNPPTMLSSRDEHQGQNDVSAVAERFFHIDTTSAPANFLKSIGGQNTTESWVRGDLLARHVLWLRDHKRAEFRPGTRFLVEGTKTEVHRSLVIGGPVSSLVLEWLARFLNRPLAQVVKLGLVYWGNGELLVSSAAITDHWEQFINSHPVYSTTRIGTALRSISRGLKRGDGQHRNKNYWIVDPMYVIDWAAQNNIGDPVEMKKSIDETKPVIN